MRATVRGQNNASVFTFDPLDRREFLPDRTSSRDFLSWSLLVGVPSLIPVRPHRYKVIYHRIYHRTSATGSCRYVAANGLAFFAGALLGFRRSIVASHA